MLLGGAHSEKFLVSIRILGKSAFQLGDSLQAETAYRKAVDVSPSALLAWKGLSELYPSSDVSAFIEVQTKLVRLISRSDAVREGLRFSAPCKAFRLMLWQLHVQLELSDGLEAPEKRLAYRRALANALMQSGRYKEAVPHLEELLRDDTALTYARMELLCSLADAQVITVRLCLASAML